MELLIVLIVLGGGIFLGRTLWQRQQAQAAMQRARAAAVSAARRRQTEQVQQERVAQQRRQVAARNVQLAILQLRQSPDFRRAASFAAAARDVPVAFRQRQFRRLRPLLVNHLAEQLRQGASADSAAAGLAELVTGLGLAAYEADYIVAEATQRTTRRPAAPPTRFEDQVQQWQAEHEQRLATLRSLALEPELKEQLLEQEETRFRDQLLAAGDPAAAQDPIQV